MPNPQLRAQARVLLPPWLPVQLRLLGVPSLSDPKDQRRRGEEDRGIESQYQGPRVLIIFYK